MLSEKKRFIYSLVIPAAFMFIAWLIFLADMILDYKFSLLGVFPRNIYHIYSVLTYSFIHGNFSHLLANSVPFLVLGTGIFYFFRDIAFRVFIYSFLFTGIGIWLIGRPVYHIGASGMVYAFASFLFFGGVFSKNKSLLAISLVVVFLYGGTIWGILPQKAGISWEGHLAGFIVGLGLAFYFRKSIPKDFTQTASAEESIEESHPYFSSPFTHGNYEIFYDFIEEDEKNIENGTD